MNKIEQFIQYFENEELFIAHKDEIILEIKNNPEILKEISQDGWSILYLSSYYQQSDIFNICVQEVKKNPDLITTNHKALYASINYDRDSLNFLQLCEPQILEKIDWNQKINDESHVSKIFFMMESKYQELKEKNDPRFQSVQTALCQIISHHVSTDIYEYNYQYNNLLKVMSLYNDPMIWDAMIAKNQQEFENYFKNIQIPNTFIDAVIFNSAYHIFDKIKHHIFDKMQSSDLDIIFKYTLKNSKEEADLYIMQTVVDEIEILSKEQITHMIKNIAYVQDDPRQQKAAVDLLDYLIKIQVPFEKMTDEYGKNILFLCIDHDNLYVFDKILEKYPHIINKVDGNNETPIYYAISKSRKEHVSSLLKKGAQTDVFNKDFETPLLKAVKLSMFDIMSEILKYYPDVQAQNRYGETPLSESLKKGAYGVPYVSKLIWSGANITRNPVIYQEEETVPQLNDGGNLQVVKVNIEKNFSSFRDLMHYGLNVFERNEFNDTLLTHSIKEGFIENTKALLVCRDNIFEYDGDNNSILMLCAKANKDEYFNVLMLTHKKGIYETINHLNDNHKTVFDLFLQQGETINAKKRLIQLLDNDEEKNISIEHVIKSVIYLSQFSVMNENKKESGLEHQLKKYGQRLNLKVLREFKDEIGNDFTKLVAIRMQNIDNFKICLDLFGVDVIEQKNNRGFSSLDMINSFPEQNKSEFLQLINLYQVQKKNSIKDKIKEINSNHLSKQFHKDEKNDIY